jgi:hypothetical protein
MLRSPRRNNEEEVIQYKDFRDYLNIINWYRKNNTSTFGEDEIFK